MRFAAFLLMLFGVTCMGCARTTPAADATTAPGSMVALEGTLTQRGNEPFTALVLETNQRNLYVLNLDDMQRDGLNFDNPKRVRITGILYSDDWNGRTMAHIRVKSMLDLASVEYKE